MSDEKPKKIVKRKNHEETIRFWDGYAPYYSNDTQGNNPKRIVDRLCELGMLQPNDCTMEIGPGPGTYSLILAPRVRKLVCMDASNNMLDRLFEGAKALGYTNIERFNMDWTKYEPKKGYDSCFAAFCPGSTTPESMQRMEATARRSCILVTGTKGMGSDLNAKIYDALGMEQEKGPMTSAVCQDWLEENKRDPIVEIFHDTVEIDMNIDDYVRKKQALFTLNGIDEDIGDIVIELLKDDTEGDIYHFKSESDVKMICWNVPE